MDWKTVLVTQEHQRELMQQAENRRLVREAQATETPDVARPALKQMALRLMKVAQRPHTTQKDSTPRVYTPAR